MRFTVGGLERFVPWPAFAVHRQAGKTLLTKLASAVNGDSNNEMLRRIYGTCWGNEKDLKAYLHMVEEAKSATTALGREMDLFHLQEEAQGSVFWHAKGYTWQQLEQYSPSPQRIIKNEDAKLLDKRFGSNRAIGISFAKTCLSCPMKCRQPKRVRR